MDYLFMDEKGPQEKFDISSPFNIQEKLKNGNDRMHSYVADVIKISDKAYKDIEEKYLLLEEEFKKKRPQLNEIKGEKILSKKIFEYGIASLHDDNIVFYFLENLFKILISHIDEIDNLLFEVGKMSIVVDSRFRNWILNASKEKNSISFLLKYTLTKYMENEAPESIIKKMLNKQVDLAEILLSIKNDMSAIIDENKTNKRMSGQIESYKEVIYLINETIGGKILLSEPKIEARFNWEKVAWAIDLMLLEIDKKEYDNSERIFYLDEGIPSEAFQKFNFKKIMEGENSEQVVGIRIVDVLVEIAGKYTSRLYLDSRHDKIDLYKRQLVSNKWFELTNKHFSLIKMMKRVYLPRERTFSINIDTYFDDLLLFVTFINYVASYQSYLKYNLLTSEQHAELFLDNYISNSEKKFIEATHAGVLSEIWYGSEEEAIEKEIRKPL